MNPRIYWNMCRMHNWHYADEDDDQLIRDGTIAHHELLDLAKKDPLLKQIRHAWVEHKFYGGPRPIEPKIEE